MHPVRFDIMTERLATTGPTRRQLAPQITARQTGCSHCPEACCAA